MNYRSFPKNKDINVSEVGFGVWSVATKWWGVTDEKLSLSLLHHAYDVDRHPMTGELNEYWESTKKSAAELAEARELLQIAAHESAAIRATAAVARAPHPSHDAIDDGEPADSHEPAAMWSAA